ncbi:MAG: hypothetical protein B7Z02_09195 [Rhodobacterales bacterium 32-67-9]|nr:MAG: hypothetical protein B7Z02_09195 [Rhodobacterales bacterium 32-67-9]
MSDILAKTDAERAARHEQLLEWERISGTGGVGDVIEARVVSQDPEGFFTTNWTAIDTVSGAGTYIGALNVSIARPWYKVQVRIQSAPATTAITSNRFAVGYVMANWGQSESARGYETAKDYIPMPALASVEDQVRNLANPGMCGRTSVATLNVAAPGNLPAGFTLSGNILTVTGTQLVTDWHFPDYQIETANGADVTFDQCLFTRTNSGTNGFAVYARTGSVARISNCTATGNGDVGGWAAAFREEDSGGTSGYGFMVLDRCKITGLSADGAKLVAGQARWCYVQSIQNIANIFAYNGSTTYQTGDRVYNTSGWAFQSKIDGNTNPLPASKQSDANWLLLDPHTDLITIEKAYKNVVVENCLLDMTGHVPANGGIGGNNNIRVQPSANLTNGWAGEITIRQNVCLRDSALATFPFQITTSVLTTVNFSGNWLTPYNTSTYIYAVTAGQSVTWQGNVKASDGTAVALPTNCVSISYTPESTDDAIQHILNSRSPIGSGTVQHVFETTGTGRTSSLRAMANVALLTLTGYKCVFLHHTVSGTGFNEALSNTDALRRFSDELTIHNYATVNGVHVGTCYSSWYASPAALALNYGYAVYELFSRRAWADGSAKTLPYAYIGGATVQNDWNLLYDTTKTRWALLGPHARPAAEAMANSLRTPTGVQFTMKNYARCRGGVRAATGDARAVGYLLPQGLEPHNWEIGNLNSAPALLDYLHPALDTLDGSGQYLTQLMLGALRSIGVLKWPVPEFDQVFWAADGSYVEVWSSAGDVTTTRKQRGMASIGTSEAHWTDCFGWEWCVGAPDTYDGVGLTPINSATIVAADGSGASASQGRVRLVKPSGTFAAGDTVFFGGGAGTGTLVHPADVNNRAWLNLPIVMVGALQADGTPGGVSVRPMVSLTRP